MSSKLPSPKSVVRWIEELLPSLQMEEGWCLLSSIVQQVVLLKTSDNDLSFETAERSSLNSIEELLRNNIAEALENNLISIYALDENDSYIKRINHDLLDVKSKIQNLESKKFEQLCAEILKLWGMERTNITGDSLEDDGGIDFMGYSNIKRMLHIPLPPQVNFTVLGQSKNKSDRKPITL